jgi:cytosine/adenosine deaminase-related metal-dependent hydrolase
MRIFKKIALVFIVMNILGIRISLVLQSGLVSDSITLLNNGIHNKFVRSIIIPRFMPTCTGYLMKELVNIAAMNNIPVQVTSFYYFGHLFTYFDVMNKE